MLFERSNELIKNFNKKSRKNLFNFTFFNLKSIDEEVRLSKVLEKKEIYEQKLNEHERKEPTHAAKSTVSSLSSPVKSRTSANDTKSNAELNDTRTTTTKSKSNDVNTSSTESLNNTGYLKFYSI